MKFLKVYRDPEETPPAGGNPAVSVNNAPPATPPAPSDSFNLAEHIPQEFKDKEYFKDVTLDGLIKDHVNLQSKLGERPAGIPSPDASQEAKDAFYGALRPKDASEYVISETEYSKQFGRDEAFQSGISQAFYKAGLSKDQVGILVQEYDNLALEMHNKATQAQEEQFSTQLNEMYKDRSQQVLDNAKGLMKQFVPESMRGKVEGLSNDALLVLASTLDGVHSKYIKEDSFKTDSSSSAQSAEQLQTQARQIMQSEAYKDFRSPGYDSARSQVQELYKQIAEIGKK